MATRVEIECVNKGDSLEPHRRIIFVGGLAGRSHWKLSQRRAIELIESGISAFYVQRDGQPLDVTVAFSQYGNRYLKTAGAGEATNLLLDLPECP